MSGSSDYTTTTNLGLYKPNYDMDDGEWGYHLNTNADTLDSAIHTLQTTSVGVTSWNTRTGAVALTTADVTTVLPASTTPPLMDGTAAVGTGTTWARADHVHASDTSRYAASNPSGYQTAAQVTTALGPYYLSSNPSGYQTAAQVTASLGSYLPLAGGTLTGPLVARDTVGVRASSGTTPQVLLQNSSGASVGGIYHDTNLNQTIVTHIAAGTQLYLDSGGNFIYANGTGGAYKIGGGSWTATTSDARAKVVDGDYQGGLQQIAQLRPVVYRFKGNDQTRLETASPHRQVAEAQQSFVGLIAQEVEAVFPDMVAQGEGFIDGAPVDDLRSLDTSALIYALVNAVKELAARIEALETPAAKEA